MDSVENKISKTSVDLSLMNRISNGINRRGFSLIESLIGTALMLVVFVSIFGVFNLGIKLVGKSKAKAGAVALGQERMEMVRNLSYDNVEIGRAHV